MVGLSRYCEAMVHSIEHLESDTILRGLITPKVYEAAVSEAKEKLPFLKQLCLPQYMHKQKSIRGMAYAANQAAEKLPELEELRKAYEAVISWIRDTHKSPLIGLLQQLSSGGAFYVAHTHHVGMQAYVCKKDPSSSELAQGARKRAKLSEDSEHPSGSSSVSSTYDFTQLGL